MSRMERKEQAAVKKESRFKSFFKKKEKQEGQDSAEKKFTVSTPGFIIKFKNWFNGLTKKKKIAFVVSVVVLVILIVVGTALYCFFSGIFDDMYRETPEDYDLSLTAVDGYYNILLLGVDTRDMDDLKTRSDAMIVVSINEETSDVKLLSIYRDTFLKLGNTPTYDKTTHACIYGGPEMTMVTLNQALDLNISNYVVVNFKAVADLVDAVGGIEVDVQDFEIQQLNKYTKQTAKNIGRRKYQLVKSAGLQTLDGCQAVSYSRIRKGVGDDFKRTERMRTVVSLTMDKMKTMSFKDLKGIIKMMTPQIQTNLPKNDVLGLAIRLPQYNIIGTTGWPYTVSTGQINEISYVFPNNLISNVIKLHQEFFGQEDYVPSDKVSVINAEIIRRIEEAREKNELEAEKEVDTQKPQKPTETIIPEEKPDAGKDKNPAGSTKPDNGQNSGGNSNSTGDSGGTTGGSTGGSDGTTGGDTGGSDGTTGGNTDGSGGTTGGNPENDNNTDADDNTNSGDNAGGGSTGDGNDGGNANAGNTGETNLAA